MENRVFVMIMSDYLACLLAIHLYCLGWPSGWVWPELLSSVLPFSGKKYKDDPNVTLQDGTAHWALLANITFAVCLHVCACT